MSELEFVPAAKNGTEQKLCECGCGKPTDLGKNGKPLRFRPGHNMRVKNRGIPESDVSNKDKGKPESQAEMKSGLDEVLGDYLDDDKKKELAAMLWEACQVKRRLSLRNDPCKECGCQHVRYVEDYDFNRSMKALDLYMTRVAGRPGTAAGDDAGVIVKLVYVGVDE